MTGAFAILTAILGFHQAFDNRHYMNPDGISYLDIADAYLRGDHHAINAYWSPLYSWVLSIGLVASNFSPRWEATVAHMVNLLVLMAAFGGFAFFLNQISRYADERSACIGGCDIGSLPRWCWLVLAYPVFIVASIDLIGTRLISPDLLASALLYAVAGLAVRARTAPTGSGLWASLGAAVGIAYLAKTAMLLTGGSFLAAALGVRHLQRPGHAVLAAAVALLLVAGPFVAAVSIRTERFTIGESARLNYAWFVNGVREHSHWQGQPPGFGVPVHPTRQIFDAPEIFEFATPLPGSYSVWYDPAYWYEGATPRFDPDRHTDPLRKAANLYSEMLARVFGAAATPTLLTLAILSGMWRFVRNAASLWFLLIPTLLPFALYGAVYVEERYVGGSVVIGWTALVAALSWPARRLQRWAAVGVVAMAFWWQFEGTVRLAAGVAPSVVGYVSAMGDTSGNEQAWAADALLQTGLQPGDEVAVFGWPYQAYWARLARIRIIAEVTSREVDVFAKADPARQAAAIRALAETGATMIVAERGYVRGEGWRQVGDTNYFVYPLR